MDDSVKLHVPKDKPSTAVLFNDGLPYVRNSMDRKTLCQAWHGLQRVTFREEDAHFWREPFTIRGVNVATTWSPSGERLNFVLPPDSSYVHLITDYFTEPARLRARKYNMPVMQSWHLYGVHEVGECTNWEKRTWLKSQTHAPKVSSFPIDGAAMLLDMFKPESVFDTCAGYGARAFAALSRSYVKHYQGCEPNTLTMEMVNEGLRALRDIKPENDETQEQQDARMERTFIVHNIPVEDFLQTTYDKSYEAGVVPSMFNMIWCSPPLHCDEIYAERDDESQSIRRFPQIENWYTKWLMPMISESWNRLKWNGVLLLHMKNVPMFRMTERTIDDLKRTLPYNRYLGVVNCQIEYDDESYPTFVWRKDKPAENSPDEEDCKLATEPASSLGSSVEEKKSVSTDHESSSVTPLVCSNDDPTAPPQDQIVQNTAARRDVPTWFEASLDKMIELNKSQCLLLSKQSDRVARLEAHVAALTTLLQEYVAK